VLTSIQTLTSYDASTQTAGVLLGNQDVAVVPRHQLSKILGEVNSSISKRAADARRLGIGANTQGTYDTQCDQLDQCVDVECERRRSIARRQPTASRLNQQPGHPVHLSRGGLIDTINNGLQSGLSDVANQQPR